MPSHTHDLNSGKREEKKIDTEGASTEEKIIDTINVIHMKGGSTFKAPRLWEADDLKTHIQMSAPEKDLVVNFVVCSEDLDQESMVHKAWQSIHPKFSLPIAQIVNIPVTDHWDKKFQIIYDVPSSELRMVMAIVRIFEKQAYLCLVDGKMAGFSRRGSDLMLMSESWKPAGFKEDQRNTQKSKDWTQEDRKLFEQFIVDAMHSLDIPGAAIQIIRKDGNTVYEKAFGIKALNSNDPVTLDTPFMIGSITKPLTSLMMGIGVDQKIFSWDTPITTLLKDFRVSDPEFDPNFTKKLTLRHTMSAATGMPQGGYACFFHYQKPEDRLREMQAMKPTTAMGETFQYSNYLVMAGGYAAASALIPTHDLESAYALAMQQLVFDPLQMKHTVLRSEDAMKLGAALPHGIDFYGKPCQVELSLENFAYSLAPAGAVWSTVRDMSNYLMLEMNSGIFNGKQLISESALLARRKPGINIGDKMSYGLCLMNVEEQGLQMVGHNGGTFGFSSDLFFMPEKEIGMVVLTNMAFCHLSFLASVKQKFLELTFGSKPCAEEMVQSGLAQRIQTMTKNQETIVTKGKDADWMEKILGYFWNEQFGSLHLCQTFDYDFKITGYTMVSNAWQSRVGSEKEKNGKNNIVLIDPPSYSTIKFSVENHDSRLVLAAGQERYEFVRTDGYR